MSSFNDRRENRDHTVATKFGLAQVSRDGYLSNVVVHYDHRGEGHGHDLLREVTEQADARGQRLMTNARKGLVPFYEKHGFVQTDEDYGISRLQGLAREPRRAD